MEMIFVILGVVILLIIAFFVIGVRVIPNDKIAVVEKWWSTKGALDEKIIALNGEAGYQPELLRGGIHILSPLMYKVHKCFLVTIPQGEIAYVFARGGKPLDPTQTLGEVIVEGNNFQNVRGFLNHGGQKGPQRGIVREGTYAFNLAQFIIITNHKTYYLPLGGKSEEGSIENMAKILKERNGFTPIVINGSDDEVGLAC